jgi:hypothetical protein
MKDHAPRLEDACSWRAVVLVFAALVVWFFQLAEASGSS